MFYILIRVHARILKQLPVPESVTDDDKRWEFRIHASSNSGKSLYHQFELNWRYFKVLLVIQKLILVAMTIFVFGMQTMMAVAVTVIHAVFFFFFMYTAPYESPVMVKFFGSQVLMLYRIG